jgi:preprotein translocase SecE subunit
LENDLSFFAAYKPGQARLSRTIALLSGLFLVAWGARSLMRTLSDPAIWPAGGLSWNQFAFLGGALEKDAWRVMVLDEKFSPALTIAAVLMICASLWFWRFVNRERWAEVLIEMEAELRKVSWPSLSDAWQSTLVVTGFTATVVVTILVYDLAIKGFINLCVG